MPSTLLPSPLAPAPSDPSTPDDLLPNRPAGSGVGEWPAPVPVKPRADVPKDANLCEYCTAKCCQYFALPIETPETEEEFDNLRWYMYHSVQSVNPVQLFVDDETWFLMVNQPCRHLQADNRCGVYEIRPQICRDYTTKSCEYDNDGLYDQFFETPEQLHEYALAVLPAKPREPVEKAQLPILMAGGRD